MSMTRRGFLAAGAAVGAAWMTGTLAAPGGAVPRAVPVAPGVTRVELGAASATMINDGVFSRPLADGFVRNVPLAEVQAALQAAGLPTDRLEIPFTPLIVDINGQRVLFDAGFGEFGPPTAGKLIERMGQAGIDPRSVSAVVFSHFHGDHIQGLRNKAGALAFPNARVFVPAPEWDWWMDDARMAAAPDAMKDAFANTRRVFSPLAGSVQRFVPGDEILPGVRSMPAFGHTPGHSAFVVDGGKHKLMYWGDTTNIAALFVRNPDWAVMFDMDADAARTTRRRIADLVVRDKMLLAGYHLPGPAVGTLAASGKGYEFTPLAG